MNLAVEQLNYLEWLVQPASVRIPKTKVEYAEFANVSRQTLYNWENLPGFNDERIRRIQAIFKQHLPDVLEALKKRCLEGEIAAIRLWLEWVEGEGFGVLNIHHSGGIDPAHVIFKFDRMSDEEFEKKAAERTLKADENTKQL